VRDAGSPLLHRLQAARGIDVALTRGALARSAPRGHRHVRRRVIYRTLRCTATSIVAPRAFTIPVRWLRFTVSDGDASRPGRVRRRMPATSSGARLAGIPFGTDRRSTERCAVTRSAESVVVLGMR
jgi:hypothetical protein